MKVTRRGLAGLLLVELDLHADARGFFVERFHLARFRRLGLPTRFVQDNHSRSLPGVLRGLHYQLGLGTPVDDGNPYKEPLIPARPLYGRRCWAPNGRW